MDRGSWQRKGARGAVRLGGMGLVVGAIVWACYPGEVTDVSQLDLVVTRYQKEADWGSYLRYAMPDSIVQIRNEDDPSDTLDLPRDCDEDILMQVDAQMEALGYERIDVDVGPLPADTPDVVLLVTATMSENWVAWIYYPGWCGWWGWWPGWGYWGCYPGYYPGWVGTTNYTTGTMFLDMLDPEQLFFPGTDPEFPDTTLAALWTAAMNGILTEAANNNCSRISTAIDQAFEQSDYLAPN